MAKLIDRRVHARTRVRLGPPPLKFILLFISCKVAAEGHRQVLTQRVTSRERSHLATVETVCHPEDCHGNWLFFRSKSLTILEQNRDIARSTTHRSKRVGINRLIEVQEVQGGCSSLSRKLERITQRHRRRGHGH